MGDRGGERAFLETLGTSHRVIDVVELDASLFSHSTMYDRSTGLVIIVIPRESSIATPGPLHTTLVLHLVLHFVDKCLGVVFGDIGFRRIVSDGPSSTRRPLD